MKKCKHTTNDKTKCRELKKYSLLLPFDNGKAGIKIGDIRVTPNIYNSFYHKFT